MGSAVSSVGEAVVSAATWATTSTSGDSSARARRTARDSPLDHDDVLEVLDILSQRIPPELALDVVEAAELWPAFAQVWTGDVTVSAGPQGRRTARTCVVSPPLPLVEGAPEQLVRRVSVWTDSRDQGYSSFPQHHGTREASSSWFELVLLRPLPPPASAPTSSASTVSSPSHEAPPPPPHEPAPADRDLVVLPSGLSLALVLAARLHSNLHSTPSFAPFTTVLSRSPPAAPNTECSPETPACCGADEVERLLGAARAGDRFAVRACAQYPMWVNRLRGAAVKVEVAAL
ncbi:hypothetical protein JCM9279_001541 [Rhodotorula babjevae]